MEIATYKNDVWGQEVLRGVSWDLLWLVIVAAFIAIAVHAIYEASQKRGEQPSSEGERVRFPASALRRFVSEDGVQGTFEMTVTENNKLVKFHRL